MAFYKFLFNYAKQYAFPAMKSFFKAYKDVTANAKTNSSGGNAGQKKHFFDQLSSKFVSKTNFNAPPIDQGIALQILNIEKNIEELEPKHVLERYYTLFKKNDPSVGGTTYLQSKVFAAKQLLMARFPNAAELEHQFYKQFVEPEQKKNNAQEQQKSDDKDQKNQNQKK